MKPHTDTPPTPPAGTGFDLLGVRHQLAEAAARGLSLFAGAFGSLLLLASLVQLALPTAGGGLERHRLLLGLVICAGAGIGHGLRRGGRPWAAASAMVMIFGGAVVMHGWQIGLGLYSTALTGLCLLVAVAGMMLGPGMAALLTAAYAAAVALLAVAEVQGLITGRTLLGTLPLTERVVGHTMLGAAGLLSALLLYRQVTGMVQAAVAEQRRLADLLGIGIDWTWEMDAQGRLTHVSQGFERSTGRSLAEFRRLGQPGGPTVADTPGLREWRAALRERRPYRDVEITLRCTDGTEIHLRGNGRPVFGAGGELRGWIGVSRNITAEVEAGRDRERAQRLIDRSRAESHAILEHASVGIALVRQRRFERVNPALEQMLGRATGSLQGRPVAEVLGGRGRIAALRAQLRQGVEFDQPFTRPDGSTVLLRLRARPLERGTPIGAGTIWVAEDVTERRRAEHELAEARRQAEAASRAKSEFLATMSHEIRTPLHGVLGLARLLQDPATETAQRERYVGHLVQAAAQLSGIVSDVLDLSKIEAGRLELEETAFDLHALVRGAFASFEVLGRERGLAMELQLAPALPRWVRGDPVRVRQILSNYLGNALKFTAQGRIVLQAGTVEGGAAGRVRLAVSDTGIGIAPALRPRLFRPFGQADNSTTRRFGGTGLGLSICRELAERMGGEVGFDSDGTHGSLFWAELPLPAASAQTGATDTEPQQPAPLAGRTVLVAEDNPVNLLIVRALLERHGARVVEATNGRAAVALAQQHADNLHAVLMDLHMPVLDGLAATRALRADARTAGLPIHALSAAVLDHDRKAAVAAGMNGFIGKPVSDEELLRALA